MKKTIFATLAIIYSASAFAATPYVEANISHINPSDIKTKTYSGTEDGLTFSNVKAKMDFDSDVGYGFEVGAKDLLVENLRVGFAFTTVKFDFNKASGSGTVTDGTDTINFAGSVNKSDAKSVGLDLDRRTKLYMINAYYDFKNSSPITPYVGVGIGFADIENTKDNEVAMSATLGAKYNINQNVYVGAKATYYNINGFKDDASIKYKDVDAMALNINIGYDF